MSCCSCNRAEHIRALTMLHASYFSYFLLGCISTLALLMTVIFVCVLHCTVHDTMSPFQDHIRKSLINVYLKLSLGCPGSCRLVTCLMLTCWSRTEHTRKPVPGTDRLFTGTLSCCHRFLSLNANPSAGCLLALKIPSQMPAACFLLPLCRRIFPSLTDAEVPASPA